MKESYKRFLTQALLALASSALLVLAFPDHEQFYLAWLALGPLCYALAGEISVKRAFLLGQLFGTGFFYGSCYWITYSMIHYGGLHPVIAYTVAFIPVLISALFPAAFAAILTALVKRYGQGALLAAPVVWTAVEYLRLPFTGIGWNSLGYSQAFQPALIWPARYGGVFLVSALAVAPGAALALALATRSRRAIVIAIVTLLLPAAIYLIGRSHNQTAKSSATVDVVSVQACAPVGEVERAELTRSLQLQIDLTRQGVAEVRKSGLTTHPLIVAWPEAPYNFDYDTNEELRRDLGDFARQLQIYLLLNADTEVTPEGVDYNSVIVIGPTGERIGQYDKIHLLPFGEYVPLRDYVPFIDRVPALAGDYNAGTKYSVIKIEGNTFGTFICFESAFPDVTREMARAGATFFINIADDAWFGPTPIGRQHLAHVVMRSAETGIPIMRVTNTGISAYIAADGRVSDTTQLFQPAMRRWQASSEPVPLTFYARFGDLFAIAGLIATVLALAWARIKRDAKGNR